MIVLETSLHMDVCSSLESCGVAGHKKNEHRHPLPPHHDDDALYNVFPTLHGQSLLQSSRVVAAMQTMTEEDSLGGNQTVILAVNLSVRCVWRFGRPYEALDMPIQVYWDHFALSAIPL
jgi:hypothetical protein